VCDREHTANCPEIVVGKLDRWRAAVTQLHADYYSQAWGFGDFFSRKVADDMAAFLARYDADVDRIWSVVAQGRICGSLTIDGSDSADNAAHLRWFITSNDVRGHGIGRRLMHEAMTFCTDRAFSTVYLTTFRGLDPARHLYEKFGFVLVNEQTDTTWGSAVLEQRFEIALGSHTSRNR